MRTSKITAMLLALCMIFTMFAATTVTSVSAASAAVDFSDIEGKSYERSVSILTALGLIAGYEDGTFGGDKTVTRAEMAGFIVRELGLSAVADSSVGATKYSDVPANHWASGYINVATTRGIIVGMGDGTFCPDREVTFQEAVKMMVCALGYEVVANRNGGWPAGYLIQGAAIGVTDGITGIAGTDACTRGVVAELMYNSLEINLMEEVSYSGSAVQVEETEKTFLYDNLSAVRLYDAEITATATQGANKTAKGEAKVSGYYNRYAENGKTLTNVTMKTGNTNPDEFFGNNVEIYYRENSGNIKPEILVILDDNGTQQTKTIKVSDFYGSNFLLFNGESNAMGTNNSKYVKLYYKTEADSKAQSVNLLDSELYGEHCTIVINGKVEEGADWAALRDLKNGVVRLIDAKSFSVSEGKHTPGSDGVYEKVIVNTYNDYVVEEIDYDNKEITATNDISFTLDEDSKVFTIRDTEGKEIKFEDIKVNDVLSVYADVIDAEQVDEAETMNIIVCNETVEGTVTEITSKHVYIDGVKYSLAGEISIGEFALDDTGIFYLNADGEIVYTDSTSVTSDYAVFYDVYQDSARRLTFSAINNKGEEVEFFASSGIDIVTYGTVNGVYGKTGQQSFDFAAGQAGDAAAILATSKESGYKPYIASFELKKGSENQIDTIHLAGETEGAESFKSRFGLWAEDISAYYNSNEATLGSYSIDASTVIFDIPVSVRSSGDSDKIKVYSKSGLKNNTTYTGVSIYEVDKNNVAKAILINSTGSDIDVNDPISVIQSVTNSKNSDGDNVNKVYMLENGKVVSKLTESAAVLDNYGTGTVEDGYTQYSLDIAYNFYPGAAIIYSETSGGEIDNLIKIYPTTSETGTEEDEVPYYRTEFFTTWNNSDYQGSMSQGCELFVVYGQVTGKNTANKTLTIKTNYKKAASDEWAATSYSANYGSANVTVVDYAFDSDEDRVSVGSASDVKVGSYVLVRKHNGTTKDIVVYSDNFNPDEYIG